MSENVWHAWRVFGEMVYLFDSTENLERARDKTVGGRPRTIREYTVSEWEDLGGPEMRIGEVLTIRPLRVERAEVATKDA